MSEELFGPDFLGRLEYLELIARRLVFGRRQALRQSARKGASIEFEDFRQYTPGDDLRIVDWPLYGRTDEMYVKIFRREEDLDLWILLDCSGSMKFGKPCKFDHARRIAAALAYIGMANMDSASVVPFADGLRPGRERQRSRGRIFGLLEYLTALEAGGVTDLETSVQAFLSRVRRPSLVVVISDFYGLEQSRAALDRLRFFKHQMHVIQLVSPWELDPPLRGDMRLVDVENQAHREITITDSMLRRYREAFQAMGEELRRYSMRYSIGYALAPSDQAFDAFIRDRLERGGLLA